MKRIYLPWLLAVSFWTGPVWGQSTPGSSESARNNFRSVTAAVVVLSGQDALSGGSFKFKNDTSPDADLDLYKWILEIPLAGRDAQFAPFLELSPSFLELEQKSEASPLVGQASVESLGFGLSSGVRAKLLDDRLELTPRLKIEYSELDYDFSFDGIEDSVLDSLVPDIDSWGYIPSLEASFTQKVSEGGENVIYYTQLAYIYNRALTSNFSIDDFSDESWVWKNRVSFEQPVGCTETLGGIFLRPSAGRIDIHGAARDGLEFNNFYELGLDVLSRDAIPEYLQELALSVTYAYEEEFQGWRFGVLAKLQ